MRPSDWLKVIQHNRKLWIELVGTQKDAWIKVYKLPHRAFGRPTLAPEGITGNGTGSRGRLMGGRSI